MLVKIIFLLKANGRNIEEWWLTPQHPQLNPVENSAREGGRPDFYLTNS